MRIGSTLGASAAPQSEQAAKPEGRTSVDPKELKPWDGSNANTISAAIVGGMMGAMLAAVPAIALFAVGGMSAGPAFALTAVGAGVFLGASHAIHGNKEGAERAWNERQRAAAGEDIDELVAQHIRVYDKDDDGEVSRPWEWRTPDYDDPGSGYRKYLDFTQRYEAVDGHKDGAITGPELTAHLQQWDTDGNGGLTHEEQAPFREWLDDYTERHSSSN